MDSSTLPRWSLASVALLHALVFAAAARALPWPQVSAFAIFAGTIAVAYLAVTVFAALTHRWLRIVWRGASILSLGFLIYISYSALSSALYVVNLYSGVGTPVAAACGAAWCVVASLTLPVACWGMAKTRRGPRTKSVGPGSIAVPAAIVSFAFLVGLRATSARGEVELNVSGHEQEISDTLRDAFAIVMKPESIDLSVFSKAPAECAETPNAKSITVFAAYVRSDNKAGTICAQAPEFDDAVLLLRRELRDAYAGGPIAIDVVESVQRLGDLDPLVGAVALRPAKDGVCDETKCFTPAQLVGLSQFTKLSGLSTFDIKVGLAADALRQAFGAKPNESASFSGLTRISTLSFVLYQDGSIDRFDRLHGTPPEVNHSNLLASVKAAAHFIVASQDPDGRFHYTLDPFTGETSMSGFGVARQAGPTMALCEVSSLDPDAARAAERSLSLLASFEKRNKDVGAIVYPRNDRHGAEIGPTALTMVAMLACRRTLGDKFDAAIARLGHAVLAMQRPNGSFYPNFDVARDEPIAGKDQLYTGGQSVLALVLWEAAEGAKLDKPPGLAKAIDHAMDYFGGPYWSTPIGDFFFLEENWHCLAAQAALTMHRNDGYERFCVNYVRMKSRLIMEEQTHVDEDFIGAYGFGDVLPPHHAATGGFAEALAASIAVEHARGMKTDDDQARLEMVLAYLLKHQWMPSNHLYTSRRVTVLGAFSENVGSPMIRIDFGQHCMSGISHGGRELGLLEESEVANL